MGKRRFSPMGIREKLQEYRRILQVAKKPGGFEFKTILKITGLGVIIIGTIGFTIKMILKLVK